MYASWTSCHRCGWYKKAQKTHQLPQDLVNSHMMNNYGKMVEAILAIRFFGLPFFWHFRLCSQHFTVKLWLPQMLPNFGYGRQILPTDVKKQGLPQMTANRPNIWSTGIDGGYVVWLQWNVGADWLNHPQQWQHFWFANHQRNMGLFYCWP